MKVMTFRELMEMPKGTMFTYYEPKVSEGLHVMDGVIRDADGTARDFWELHLLPEHDLDTNEMTVEECCSRWGWYDYEAKCIVYEQAELEFLRTHVATALSVCAKGKETA